MASAATLGADAPSHVGPIPLVRRFPALAELPRVPLGTFPTPVERVDGPAVPDELWIKRDDLSAAAFGGNKVRALEFLLGRVRAGDDVLTVGGEGSTHVLTTAAHAARLGARTGAYRWRHEMNPAADAVAARASELCERVVTSGGPVRTLAWTLLVRARHPVHWVPPGGTCPLGILGHVNAALELSEQVASDTLPCPVRVVVPLGSGGTAAGLALGFAIAGLPTVVLGARVAPRVTANRARVLRLARATAALIARVTGERLPSLPRDRVEVVHEVYGGAYGRPTMVADEAAALLRRVSGVPLDATYSAKAFATALASTRGARGPTLFWLTFDGRWLGEPRWRADVPGAEGR